MNKTVALSAKLLILLGALTAFDSIAIDMYLPAFNIMEQSLNLAEGTMQISLSVFLIGLAVGQAISGPLVDSMGRRGPLLFGIILFGLGSILVAISFNAEILLIGRFIQGIGGAAGLVIPRVIASDICEEKEASKIFTFLIQIQSISPILAPILGGVLLGFIGWQGIFWTLAIFALLAFIATQKSIPETLPIDNRSPLNVKSVVKNYWEVLKTRRFLGMGLSAGLIMGTLFGYISSSSFIFMTHFNLTPFQYGIMFAIISVGMIIVGQLNYFLTSIMSTKHNLALGFSIHVPLIIALAAIVFMGNDNFMVISILLFLTISSLSLLFGGITAETMYSVDHAYAGSASALLGVIQYSFGGLTGVVLGYFNDGTLSTPIIILAINSCLAVFIWKITKRKPQEATAIIDNQILSQQS